ncbi:hypothetical protein KTN00_02720 [Acinetobacter soli]|uniref:hypothetical protein n=1 Tax=Acinetobacter soli TaxID=487316 RepID=UPI001C45F1E0|nr:hypothetical protein [Acinetobacter soli]MBV6549945.1 hypothetical protein [Acinetobacter soli]
MKKLLLGLGLACSISLTNAANESQDKYRILDMMKQYSRLVSCMNSFEKIPENGRPTTIKDVTTVEYSQEENSYVFYVFWGGDMGCAGGSGTGSNFVTEVARYGGDWKPYTIQTDYAFGENLKINYRFIESIKKINKNKFEVVSWDYADDKYGGADGGNNFPANKFKYTLERNNFEPWRVTNQTLLEQNK